RSSSGRRGPRVDPFAAQDLGFLFGHPPFGVDLPREALGRPSSVDEYACLPWLGSVSSADVAHSSPPGVGSVAGPGVCWVICPLRWPFSGFFSGFLGTRKVARSAGGRERACKNCVLAVFACRDGVFGVAPGESVAPRVGLEPTTNGLTVHCSAN